MAEDAPAPVAPEPPVAEPAVAPEPVVVESPAQPIPESPAQAPQEAPQPKGEGDPQAPKTSRSRPRLWPWRSFRSLLNRLSRHSRSPSKSPPPQQPVRMTPSEVRQARQLSRADRFHELLLRNSMDI